MIDHVNLLMIGLYQAGAQCAALAKLRTFDGEVITVAGVTGASPWGTLASVLKETQIIKAWEVLILSNIWLDFKREMPPPSDVIWYQPKPFAPWIVRKGLQDKWSDPERFATLRLLFHYDKWKFVEVAPETLAGTKLFLEGKYNENLS